MGDLTDSDVGARSYLPAVLHAEVEHAIRIPALPMDAAERLVHTAVDQVAADRCVVVNFERSGDSVVLATAGMRLCQPGTRLPIALSTMYCKNRDGEIFVGEHLKRAKGFRRISDRALLALGLNSAISIPLWQDGHVSGAVYAAATPNCITDRPDLTAAALAKLAIESSAVSENSWTTPAAPEPLTSREVQVVIAVSAGLTSKQIANRLYISPHTVGNHMRSIYRKLGVSSRVGAMRRAHEVGVI